MRKGIQSFIFFIPFTFFFHCHFQPLRRLHYTGDGLSPFTEHHIQMAKIKNNTLFFYIPYSNSNGRFELKMNCGSWSAQPQASDPASFNYLGALKLKHTLGWCSGIFFFYITDDSQLSLYWEPMEEENVKVIDLPPNSVKFKMCKKNQNKLVHH